MKTLTRSIAWPAVVLGALSIHWLLFELGAPLWGAAYAAVALGAIAVALLERLLPYRADWQRAEAGEVASDIGYLALVQVALPVGLAVVVVQALSAALRGLGFEAASLWPHHWPVVVQALAMLLLADALRYGLHVASHHFAPLWRLHAVHHAPRRLYFLNVARFHPLEKTLHYGLDALPFALLGLAPEVLALYFVFYAVNGFYQHSNVDVRLGWLNRVVAGPELHRWHHSSGLGEGNANYGNNLILFDQLFGTRFLPADRTVTSVGLEDGRSPQHFIAQWRSRLGEGRVFDWLLQARMAWLGATSWPRMRRHARAPAARQRKALMRILAANRKTRFGVAHDFGSIENVDDFRRAVPVHDYEDLRPWIEAEDSGTVEHALTSERPVLYAQTSGTTGEPKYVPILARTLRAHRRLQALAAYVQYRSVPGAYDGRVLGIVSPAVEGYRPSGIGFGSASGHIYAGMPRAARAKYVLPAEVFEVDDYELKYRLILRLALVAPDITAIATANPSTLLKLLEVLDREREALLSEIEGGVFRDWGRLPAAVQNAVGPHLSCSAEHLHLLRDVLSKSKPDFSTLWPGLRLVSTWTGGSCGIALESVRRALPAGCRVAELGYLASEVRGTVTVDLDQQLGLPALDDVFFEFVRVDAWDAGEPRFLGLEALDVGCDYYVIVTTDAGLYRYFMNDIVRVTGRHEATPTLAFVQKGKGVTNMTGEKLYEGQVIEAVTGALEDVGWCSPFFVALACLEESRYRVLLELEAGDASALAERIDAQLCDANLEYAAKRKSGRLSGLECVGLRPGAGDAYKKERVAAGQREGQFKALALQTDDAFDFDWRGWVR